MEATIAYIYAYLYFLLASSSYWLLDLLSILFLFAEEMEMELGPEEHAMCERSSHVWDRLRAARGSSLLRQDQYVLMLTDA